MDAEPCPGENTLLDYAGGLLETPEIDRIDRHVDTCPACRLALGRWLRAGGPETGAPAEIGDGAVVDRYTLQRPLGAGGMGLVFAAHDPVLERTVAIKVLRHEVATSISTSARVRMLREARAMARLAHPNVVAVYDAGLFHGRVYLAMEHLEGGSLADWLEASPRSWRQVRDVFVQAGRGLAAAHQLGMVHRDFKPQNVLFTAEGQVKISDFGLVRLTSQGPGPEPGARPPASAEPGAVTAAGTVMGTPGYIAPESRRGGAPDSRSDQYSFCAALHLALHGQLPSDAKVATSQVPGWLSRLVARGLSADPDLRYPSMEALLAELSSRAPRIRRGAVATGALLRRWGGAVAAAAVLAVVAGGGALAISRRPPPWCGDFQQRLKAAWGPSQGAELQAAFERTTVPAAVKKASWEHLRLGIDELARALGGASAAACAEAHRDREAFALRADCLDAQVDDLDQLVRALASANDRIVREGASRAVSAFPPASACAQAARIDPAVRAVHRRLEEARMLHRAGEDARAASIAEPLIPEARSTKDPAILAGTLALVGELRASEHPSDARGVLAEAMEAARAAGQSTLAEELAPDPSAAALERAVSQAEKEFGPDHPRVAGLLLRWARATKDLEKGANLASLARRIYGQAYGERHPDALEALDVMSQIARERDAYQVAMAFARRALDETVAVYGAESLEVARRRRYRAGLMEAYGDVEEAKEEYRASLPAYERASSRPWGGIDVAALHDRIGWCHYLLGEDEAAFRELEQARTANQSSSTNVVETMTGLGVLAAAAGRMDQMADRFQRITTFVAKQNSEQDLTAFHLREGLAHHEAFELDRAEKSYLQAFQLMRAGSATRGLVEVKLLAVQLAKGPDQKLLAWKTSKALDFLESVFGKDHSLTVQALTAHGEALRRDQKLEEALPFLWRAAKLHQANHRRPIDRAVTFLTLANTLRQAKRPATEFKPWLDAAEDELEKSPWGDRWRRALEMRQ